MSSTSKISTRLMRRQRPIHTDGKWKGAIRPGKDFGVIGTESNIIALGVAPCDVPLITEAPQLLEDLQVAIELLEKLLMASQMSSRLQNHWEAENGDAIHQMKKTALRAKGGKIP